MDLWSLACCEDPTLSVASLQEYLIGLRTKARRFDNGLKALQSGDYQDAIMNFEIFLGVLPSSWEARNNLGVATGLALSKKVRVFLMKQRVIKREYHYYFTLPTKKGQKEYLPANL